MSHGKQKKSHGPTVTVRGGVCVLELETLAESIVRPLRRTQYSALARGVEWRNERSERNVHKSLRLCFEFGNFFTNTQGTGVGRTRPKRVVTGTTVKTCGIATVPQLGFLGPGADNILKPLPSSII